MASFLAFLVFSVVAPREVDARGAATRKLKVRKVNSGKSKYRKLTASNAPKSELVVAPQLRRLSAGPPVSQMQRSPRGATCRAKSCGSGPPRSGCGYGRCEPCCKDLSKTTPHGCVSESQELELEKFLAQVGGNKMWKVEDCAAVIRTSEQQKEGMVLVWRPESKTWSCGTLNSVRTLETVKAQQVAKTNWIWKVHVDDEEVPRPMHVSRPIRWAPANMTRARTARTPNNTPVEVNNTPVEVNNTQRPLPDSVTNTNEPRCPCCGIEECSHPGRCGRAAPPPTPIIVTTPVDDP